LDIYAPNNETLKKGGARRVAASLRKVIGIWKGSKLAGGPNREGDRLLSITVFRFGETIDSKASY
jgi:hypothetical protein